MTLVPNSAAVITFSSSALVGSLASTKPSIPLSWRYKSPVVGWKAMPAGLRSPVAIWLGADELSWLPSSTMCTRWIASPASSPPGPIELLIESVSVVVAKLTFEPS